MTARSNPHVAERPPAFINFAPVQPRTDAPSRWRSISLYALWVVQVALALLFFFAGGSKFVLSAKDLTKDTALSATFLRFIGVCEVLGAIGLLASALGHAGRVLTPLAAAGLVIIMIGATIVTVVEGSAAAAAVPLLVGLLAAFVVYGRWSWLADTFRTSTRRLQWFC